MLRVPMASSPQGVFNIRVLLCVSAAPRVQYERRFSARNALSSDPFPLTSPLVPSWKLGDFWVVDLVPLGETCWGSRWKAGGRWHQKLRGPLNRCPWEVPPPEGLREKLPELLALGVSPVWKSSPWKSPFLRSAERFLFFSAPPPSRHSFSLPMKRLLCVGSILQVVVKIVYTSGKVVFGKFWSIYCYISFFIYGISRLLIFI